MVKKILAVLLLVLVILFLVLENSLFAEKECVSVKDVDGFVTYGVIWSQDDSTLELLIAVHPVTRTVTFNLPQVKSVLNQDEFIWWKWYRSKDSSTWVELMELSDECMKKKFKSGQIDCLKKAWAKEKDDLSKEKLNELGYYNFDGKFKNTEERNRDLGMQLVYGKWVWPEEKEALVKNAEAKRNQKRDQKKSEVAQKNKLKKEKKEFKKLVDGYLDGDPWILMSSVNLKTFVDEELALIGEKRYSSLSLDAKARIKAAEIYQANKEEYHEKWRKQREKWNEKNSKQIQSDLDKRARKYNRQ